MTTSQTAIDGAPVHVDHRARIEILIAIMLTLFLSALDQTIVGTALPRIVTDLTGNQYYVWVVTVYLLAATVSGPIYGKLSDQFGRRPMIMIGVSLFLLGSLLCGLSQEMWQLIVFRGLQGLGAGAIFPISLAIIGDLFSPRERGKYQGLFGAMFAVASIIGPALGGFLTDTISWHWVFFVNLPLGLFALFVLWRLLPSVRHPESVQSIDYWGAAVFAGAIVPFLIGLTNKQTGEWTDPLVGGLILLGVILGVVFVWIESRAKEPIIPLELFRNRTVTGSIIATLLITFGFFGAIIFLPRWFQFVQGSSATISGYQMLPLMAGVLGSSVAVRPHRRSDRSLQVDDRRGDAAQRGRHLLHDRDHGRDAGPPRLAVDVHRGHRHRSVVRGLHDRRPERGRAADARIGDQRPDVLPAGRRVHRPRDRGDDLRQPRSPPRFRASSRARACRSRSSMASRTTAATCRASSPAWASTSASRSSMPCRPRRARWSSRSSARSSRASTRRSRWRSPTRCGWHSRAPSVPRSS